ncbi:hypothetical protein BOTCAL_0283g00020 [Botryotinia calthae]|uniref:Uncharacterized protein n=1 Tax=Botryotinia calthae TaxID=38488 RepID=A0A4Y8CXS8_9HELO|nr:hypothetical protein BOTCAL_0283g00020 [Botryotinia calthae]
MVEAKLKKDIKKYGELFGIDDLHISSLQEALASVYWSSNRWKMAENLLLEVITTRQNLQGKCHQDTLNSKMGLARAYIDEEVLSRPSRAEELRSFRTELLNGIKSNSRIEERIMILAAEYFDERMFKLLLGLEKDSVLVTEILVKVIFRPERGDGKILILLEERGMDSEITEDMVHFIAKNFGLIAMKLLMQKRRADVQYTGELLRAVLAGREAVKMMELLLDGRRADTFIDNGLLTTIARMHYPDVPMVIELILQKQGANMAITEETMIAAVRNTIHGNEIIEQLFAKSGANIVITEKTMIAAIGNIIHGANIIEQLFAKSEANIVITEEIIIVAVGNEHYGANIIKQLFAKQRANIVITEEIMIAAIGNKNHGANIIEQLFAKSEANIVITEEVMIAAAGNEHYGANIIEQLFAKSEANIVITKEIIIAAIENRSQGEIIIKQSFAKPGANMSITEEIMITACSIERHKGIPEIVRALLEMRGASMPITEEIVIAAVGNKNMGTELLRVLLEMRGADINITPEVIKAVSKNRRSIKALLPRLVQHDDIMMQLLGKNKMTQFLKDELEKDIMMQLFEKRGADMEVTEEIVKIIISISRLAIQALALLFKKQGEKLRVTEEMVRIVQGELPEEVALLEMMKDNIQKYSSGSASSTS